MKGTRHCGARSREGGSPSLRELLSSQRAAHIGSLKKSNRARHGQAERSATSLPARRGKRAPFALAPSARRLATRGPTSGRHLASARHGPGDEPGKPFAAPVGAPDRFDASPSPHSTPLARPRVAEEAAWGFSPSTGCATNRRVVRREGARGRPRWGHLLALLSPLATAVVPGACARPAPPAPPPAQPVAPQAAASAAEQGAPPIAGRLPSDVRPLHYRLDLSLDPAQTAYRGDVEIELALERPRSILWLHGRGLSLQPPTVRGADDKALVGQARSGGDDGLVAVALPASVGPGRVTLRISFAGTTRRTCSGLYRYEHEGSPYLFSQLEPTYARDVFPSFDEPGYKAPFDVSITTPAKNVAISNARKARTEALPGRRTTFFATTPPLPTYALAFAVGPFDLVAAPPVPPNALRSRPLPLRGAALRGEGDRLRWALGQVPALLDDLERYLDAEYPFDKLDFLAVPCTYPTATENAGAVTVYRQVLLQDPARSTEAERRTATSVIAHEFAHMWFGNSVTPGWWDDLWLKESFATWFEATAVGRQRRDDRPAVALLKDTRDAMARDGVAATRALRHPVRTEAEIRGGYDRLTYDKGAALLGMVERLAGPGAFQGVLRTHLARHRGGVATADDLLGELETGAGRDAAEALRSFVTQPGVPSVEARLDCGGAVPALRLRQSRHVPAGRTIDPARTWHLPVCARYPDAGGTRERCTIVREAEGSLELPSSRCPAWVMPNADGVGYYRWLLPATDLRRLGTALPSLGARERISFVDAVQVGALRGALAPADAIELLAPLTSDPEPLVAIALATLLTRAPEWLAADAAALRNFERFAQRLYAAPLAAVGAEPERDESPERAEMRHWLLPFLALTARDPAVRARLAAQGRAHLGAKNGGPPPDPLALRLAVADGGAPMFDAALARFTTASPDQRWPYLYALASAELPGLAARARALAFDGRVLHEEVYPLLSALVEAHPTRNAAWDWIAANLSALRARALDEQFSLFPRLAAGLCEASRADELVARFAQATASDKALATELEEAAQAIRACAGQREAMLGPLREFFARPR
ncbi:MAG TPA: M1 family metallopeptidase [Polyangiaceae bacterium]|nr:M1 family metallopeptidase [Polyangiaceae bacterium]